MTCPNCGYCPHCGRGTKPRYTMPDFVLPPAPQRPPLDVDVIKRAIEHFKELHPKERTETK